MRAAEMRPGIGRWVANRSQSSYSGHRLERIRAASSSPVSARNQQNSLANQGTTTQLRNRTGVNRRSMGPDPMLSPVSPKGHVRRKRAACPTETYPIVLSAHTVGCKDSTCVSSPQNTVFIGRVCLKFCWPKRVSAVSAQRARGVRSSVWVLHWCFWPGWRESRQDAPPLANYPPWILRALLRTRQSLQIANRSWSLRTWALRSRALRLTDELARRAELPLTIFGFVLATCLLV